MAMMEANVAALPTYNKSINIRESHIMIERRKLLKIGASGAAASVAMPFIGRTGWAATAATTLKLTFADTQNHPLYDVLKRFSADVSQRTSGAVESPEPSSHRPVARSAPVRWRSTSRKSTWRCRSG
jgi:hypothetical protein